MVVTPRLIGMSDQTVLFNRALVDLRARLASTTDPFQQSVIRLNTAVALARLGECATARDELKQVQLPDRPGVGNGTVQYLLGVCAEELGNRAEAEAAFRAAAATESLLTEDGPPVKELAEARLAQLGTAGSARSRSRPRDPVADPTSPASSAASGGSRRRPDTPSRTPAAPSRRTAARRT